MTASFATLATTYLCASLHSVVAQRLGAVAVSHYLHISASPRLLQSPCPYAHALVNYDSANNLFNQPLQCLAQQGQHPVNLRPAYERQNHCLKTQRRGKRQSRSGHAKGDKGLHTTPVWYPPHGRPSLALSIGRQYAFATRTQYKEQHAKHNQCACSSVGERLSECVGMCAF